MSNSVVIETINSDFILRFNNPEMRSPLSISVLDKINIILDELPADIERVIFTGTDGVFASGANLREIANLRANDVRFFAQLGQGVMAKIASLQQMTIAAIDGPCYGGALDLALACDVRICSPRSTFCHPGAGLGIITGWGGTQRLPRLIGLGNALEMFFTASPIAAERALRFGLVSAVVDDLLSYLISADLTSTSAFENLE